VPRRVEAALGRTRPATGLTVSLRDVPHKNRRLRSPRWWLAPRLQT
jgi:hypothetical protein